MQVESTNCKYKLLSGGQLSGVKIVQSQFTIVRGKKLIYFDYNVLK